ncbi:restriction endonuclease subunit S [Providencia rettgeri]|nr:restriction endonuclease subunit S [Providencia rettgeri]
MEFKQYPNYKDSGVEWLSDIPESWGIKRFSYVFNENKNKNTGLKETNVLSLSYGNIIEKNIDDNKGLLPESFETYQIIEPNYIIFRFTDLQNDKRSLRSAISKYHGIITSAYIGVKTKENADFYNYLFRAYDLQKVFYSMGDGMRQSLKMDELNKMPIVVPPLIEQQEIVSFLDAETTRIDNLIAKQEKLIELLEEQRKSIISHAVTKGLNPDAPMKDSGVEWLGEVPEHWDVMQLKSAITNWRNGKWGNDVNHNQKGNLICVRVADFDRKKGIISKDKLTLRNYENESIASCLLFDNHILIERSGGGDKQLVGATVRYTLENGQAVCSNFISLLHIDKNIFNVKYMQYSFEHLYYLGVNRLSIKQTSGIQNLDLKQYIQNNFAFPECREQGKIVDFLDIETDKIDNLITKQNELIQKLKEYRSSIISHAVTGKIDVREIAV